MAGGLGDFNAGQVLFGHSHEGHELHYGNFRAYWFKNCHLKYSGVLAGSEDEARGEETFGARPEVFNVLTEKRWLSLDLGVASPYKSYYPGLLPIGVARYYNFPSDVRGRGQRIAIVTLGGRMDEGELRDDFEKLGIDPMPNITLRDVNDPPISKAQDRASSGEGHLDVEVIASICPEAEITIYRGARSAAGFTNALKAAVADGNQVISISWTHTERAGDATSEMERVLLKAAERGVTVCVDAGDGGSSNQRRGNLAIPAADERAHVGYPCSSPHVLACGGTEIAVIHAANTEIAWNNSEVGGGATGGGVSEVFPIPDWQSEHGIAIESANGGKRGRILPDVSGLAAYSGDGDWNIFENGRRVRNGGTSAVAPLWASLITLVNERRERLGKGPVGFVNEALYALAARGGLFKDVRFGDNKPTANYPGYEARQGFDACTGWGVPNGSLLADALVGLPESLEDDDGGFEAGSGGGGAPLGFDAPNLKDGFRDVESNPNAPRYRVCGVGLNLDADCPSCGKSPIIKKGLVDGNAGSFISGNTCTACGGKLKMSNYTGWWLYYCNFDFKGVMMPDEELVEGSETFADSLLHRTKGDPVHYAWLNIKATPI